MTDARKKQIASALGVFCQECGSQNSAANKLNGVSSATISQILNGNWENIADGMWTRIAKQTGTNEQWVFAYDTETAKRFRMYFGDAQRHSMVHAIVEREGGGKTESAKKYCAENANAWLINCAEYFNRKVFLAHILQAMGKDSSGSAAEMMDSIIYNVEGADEPLLMFDEVDKLPDPVLSFFITLYNKLEDKCGIVLMATDHLAKRIEKGRKLNKRGYKEIFSRIGRRFVDIMPKNKETFLKEDISKILRANGIENTLQITEITNLSDYDFRRVKKLVYATKQKEAA